MKWCKPHWDQLKAAVELRGLTSFVAKDSQEAHANMVEELEGGDPPFDPLMGSFWRINSAMMKDVGMRLMGHCPLCILIEDGQPELVQNWIDGVTDGALAYAREQGLVKVQ